MMIRQSDDTYILHIADRDYTLKSGDPPDHIQWMAEYINSKITEAAAGGLSAGRPRQLLRG